VLYLYSKSKNEAYYYWYNLQGCRGDLTKKRRQRRSCHISWAVSFISFALLCFAMVFLKLNCCCSQIIIHQTYQFLPFSVSNFEHSRIWFCFTVQSKKQALFLPFIGRERENELPPPAILIKYSLIRSIQQDSWVFAIFILFFTFRRNK
jgi:hypothetical protein